MLSKDRLNELALEVWGDLEDENAVGEFIVTDFAHALIKRIEQEAEVVAWRCTNFSHDGNDYAYRDFDDRPVSISGVECGEPLITLPLVEGDTE